MDRLEGVEPLRRTQSANAATRDLLPGLRNPSPLRAPALMLVNGAGEASKLPSPIFGNSQEDDEDRLSEMGSPVDLDFSVPVSPSGKSHSKSLSVPTLMEAPLRVNGNYSPLRSPVGPPPPSPKRTGSPPKLFNDGKNKARPNHRRGHHHKHSLSHQLFLPPPERPPLPLPSHLPIPTTTEILNHSNINSHHTLPILLQIMATIYLSQTSTGESSLVALTFLAINDLLASFVQLFSQTMTGFDVWRTPTLRFPFGLQRLETLAEFALGVFGTFTGLYVLKETVEDIIIGFSTRQISLEGSAGGHHHHHHYVEADPERVSPGGLDLPVLFLCLCTAYLMRMLSPHAKTSKLIAIRVDYLTLASCIVIILIPLLGLPSRQIIDRALSLLISFIMVAIGLTTGKVWGSILLCIPSKDEKVLIKNISASSAITSIDKYRLFRTTHRSGIATFTIHVHGGEDDEVAVREHIGRCITDWDKGVKWEYYVDFHP